MKNTLSLRAMSYTFQHATPNTDTSSSPSPVSRSSSHCANLRTPLERDTSPALPPPKGYERNRIEFNQFVANRIVDNCETMHFTEDDQVTELEDRVKPLSYNQSFLPSTSAESIATPPEADLDDEQLRTLLASPLYLNSEEQAQNDRKFTTRNEKT